MKGELLKRLFRAIALDDQEAIDKLTCSVIEDERKKGHTLLANQLENITKKNQTDSLVKKSGDSNGSSLQTYSQNGITTNDALKTLSVLPTSHRVIASNRIEKKCENVDFQAHDKRVSNSIDRKTLWQYPR